VGAYTKRKATIGLCGYSRLLLLISKDPIQIGYQDMKLKLVLQDHSFNGSSWMLNNECINHIWIYTSVVDYEIKVQLEDE
jgi:hypothetical protein